MAIYRLIAAGSSGPDEAEAMAAAYEKALAEVGLVDRDDQLTEIIAKSIANATGERDPDKIKERAINAIGVRKIDVGKTDAA